jgi:hypothetical protein
MPLGVAGAVALGGAALSAGASVYGSSQQAGAVKDAASKQAAAAAQQRQDFAPWREAGGTANTQAANLLGLYGQPAADTAMQTFQSSPGYQFQLEQGLRGVDASAAARGMLRSGATLKAEQTFGQGLAAQDFGNYYNRLMDLSKTGESAAAGQGTTTNTQIAGASRSGEDMASIYGNNTNSLAATGNTLLNNPAFQNSLKGLGSSGGGSVYDPQDYGYVAGGAGTSSLPFTPLGTRIG